MKFRNRKPLHLLSLSASLLFATGLCAQFRPAASDPLSARASSRIAATIDDGVLQLLPGNHHPLARPEFDAGAVAPDLPMQSMVLVLQPSASQQSSLDALLEDQRNPASPRFHQWLTPEQYAEHFGASAQDVQQIQSWLESNGMQVGEVTPSRRSITFSGTASQVERAFSTTIRHYRVNGVLHLANATDPSIPRALTSVVSGVLSLHDFSLRSMHSSIRPVAQMSFGTAHYISPADLATIYNVNPLYTQGLDGSGQSVAVVARSNIQLSDVHTFRATFGLPVNDPQVIVNGPDPGSSDFGEQVEATLDAEYAGALARQAKVKLVATASTSTTDGTYLSAQYIVNHGLAPVMTMSFGLCEAQLGTAGNAYINALWQQAAAQGITVLVSAGDSGAAGCDSGASSTAQYGLAVNGLCSTPYDLCIGGTEFNDTANPSLYWSDNNVAATNGSALGYIPEVVWNESNPGLWAGAGGASSLYGKPAWQSGNGSPSDAKRDVPDISLTAAGHDGYLILVNGQLFVVGGTSASSPTLAGILALVVQSTGVWQGLANPTLYTLANRQSATGEAIFHDVTTGANTVPGLTGYSAGTGYDRASGLGSVDANALVTHWRDGQATAAIQLTLNKTSVTLPPSTAAPVAISVAALGKLNTAVKLTTSGLPKGVTATFSPASIAAPGTGNSNLSLTASTAVQPGSYLVEVTATAGTLTKTTQLTLNLPSLSASLNRASLSLAQGNGGVLVLTTKAAGGFDSAASISIAGLPAGVSSTFSPATLPAPGAGTVSIRLTAGSSASLAAAKLTILVSGGGITASVPLTLTITPRPTFNLAAASAAVKITAGGSAVVPLTSAALFAFTSPLSLSATGARAGVTLKLSTSAISPGQGTNLTITSTPTAAAALANLTVTATGGGQSKSVTIALTLTAAASTRK